MLRDAQQQCLLPVGAFKLLQHWPAVQLELLTLVKEAEHYVSLLPPAVSMLEVSRLAGMPLSDLTAVKRTMIKPLLQLVVLRVQLAIKALRDTAGSAAVTKPAAAAAATGADLAVMLMLLRSRHRLCCWSASSLEVSRCRGACECCPVINSLPNLPPRPVRLLQALLLIPNIHKCIGWYKCTP
jgi:hypothetical protein